MAESNVQSRWITYEPVLILYLAALIIQAPILHQFLYHRAEVDLAIAFNNTNSTTDSHTECIQDVMNVSKSHKAETILQRTASRYIMAATMSYTFPAIFSSLLLGAWSDKRGRKVCMLLPVIGSGCQASLTLATAHFRLPIFVVCIGCGIAGLSGYYTAIMLSCLAYIADVTPQRSRAFRMGIMEAITFSSGLVGQFFSGMWIKRLGYQSPFFCILVIHLINIVYIVCRMPESLPKDLEKKSALPDVKCVKTIWLTLTKPRAGGRWRLGLILIVSMLSLFTGSTISLLAVLFSKNFPLCWQATLIGYFFGLKSAVKAAGTVAGIKGFRYLGLSNHTVAQIGLIFQIAGLVFIAFTRTTLAMFLVPLVGVLCGMAVPCIRAQMSSMVNREEQGALFAVIASTESLSSFSAHAILNLVYSWSLSLSWKHAAGFVFLMNAGVTVLPLALLSLLKRKPPPTDYEEIYSVL